MTNTDIATTDQRDSRPPIVVLRDRLQMREGELKAALGPDIPVATFVRAIMTSVALNPEILGCSWTSIWNACLKACRDGLIPDGQDAAIVPYKNTATYVAMYQGMLRRFRRSGTFKWITANVVREGEEFLHFIDETGEHFRHVPIGDVTRPIIKIYALATTKDDGVFVAVMSKTEADKVKAMSRTTREDSPWKQWPEEMYKKTALRRLSKYLPSARDLLPDEELPDAPALTSISSSSSVSDRSSTPAESGTAEGSEQDAGLSRTTVVPGAPAAADADETVAAFERGKADRAKNVQRRALPGELRTPGKEAEATSWLAGWDAEPS